LQRADQFAGLDKVHPSLVCLVANGTEYQRMRRPSASWKNLFDSRGLNKAGDRSHNHQGDDHFLGGEAVGCAEV
jgi:hypothetical protein